MDISFLRQSSLIPHEKDYVKSKRNSEEETNAMQKSHILMWGVSNNDPTLKCMSNLVWIASMVGSSAAVFES